MDLNIVAIIFAVTGIGLNLFQGIVNMPILGSVNLLNFISLFMSDDRAMKGINLSSKGDFLVFCIVVAPIVAPILALIAIIRTIQKKEDGNIYLTISSFLCGLVSIFISSKMSEIPDRERRQMAQFFISYNNFLVWAICYGIGAVTAYLGKTADQSEQPKVKLLNVSDSPITGNQASTNIAETVKNIFNPSPAQPVNQNPNTEKVYEPIVGLETEALIKRAFLFLEDGQFDDAGRYLNQALNQDAEDARIHFGQLLLVHKAHSVEEFLENLDTPLENEKLFQRALRFAQGEYKSQLEFYVRTNQKKLEQKRLAEEAERERQLAEQEAENERRYQEILTLKEKAYKIPDFNELLQLLSLLRIRSYKDTEKIYAEVKEALNVETKYQNAQRKLQNASGFENLKNVIKTFEELDDYKDSEKLLEEAQGKLEALEEYAKKARKRTLTVIALAVIAIGSFFGWKWYKDKTSRENAMIVFFEERYDEAVDAINAIPSSAYNPVLLNMLAYIDYDKSGSNYEQFRNKAESLIKSYAEESKKSYSDALSLSNKYLSKIPANKFQGDIYVNGWGTGKDVNKSIERFKVAAESGDIYSQEALVKIYDTVLNDQQSAMQWYQKLADNGNANAQLKVADMLYSKEDYVQAAKLYLKLGENGNARLQNRLGEMYHMGRGVKRDYSEAAKWYEKAANQGLADAQNNLAVLYENGLGVTKSKERALEWYKKAADQGDTKAKAQYDRLSTPAPTQNQSYSSGRYSLERIEEWYELGNQYLEDKNYSPAVKYFRWAADENYAPAQDKLGWMYQNGWGVEQDYSKAREWYLKAANQGNHFAQASIGLLYYKGWGVQQDLEESLKWYKKAAAQGHQTAIKRVTEIEREIYNQNNQQKFSQIDYQGSFPVAATIFGNKVNIRRSSTINSSSITQLNAGHPVSVSRRSSEYDGDWYHVKTASGTEGWVKGDYVALNTNVKRTQREIDNRRKSLPAKGYITDTGDGFLNVRNIPSLKSSKAIGKAFEGSEVTVYEIFSEEDRDWYRVRTKYGAEGWSSGRFIQLR